LSFGFNQILAFVPNPIVMLLPSSGCLTSQPETIAHSGQKKRMAGRPTSTTRISRGSPIRQ